MSGLPLYCLAPAKINLGLFVGPVRADGRHELVSVMQSISLADELTLQPNPDGDGDTTRCPDAPDLEGDNLAGRALEAFRWYTGWDPGPLLLTLAKRVPVAAGMGGGSGDAAAVLRLAAHAAGIEDPSLLQRLAQQLGADVPAQVAPGRWLARGVGERLQELPPPRQQFGVVVLPSPTPLSTAAVYAEADRLGGARTAAELDDHAARLLGALGAGEQLPSEDLLANDLQAAAVSLCPAIEHALDLAREAGAEMAMVSGSGPTVLGLFGSRDGPERARLAAETLAERHMGALAAVPVEADFAEPRPVRNNGEADRQGSPARNNPSTHLGQ